MTPERIDSIPAADPVPAILASWLAVFRPCFTAPVWSHILVLIAGAVVVPGKRTVTQALRVMGLADQPGSEGPSVRKRTVRNENTDNLPTVSPRSG